MVDGLDGWKAVIPVLLYLKIKLFFYIIDYSPQQLVVPITIECPRHPLTVHPLRVIKLQWEFLAIQPETPKDLERNKTSLLSVYVNVLIILP